jgi:DNA-binding Xre family transcriptional regulator
MIRYDRLWEYMEKTGMTQYRLVKLGISNSTITRLKRNETVNTDTIGKLCGILNCDVEDIMEDIKE